MWKNTSGSFTPIVYFLNNMTTVVTLSYNVSLLWNAAPMMPSVQLISRMQCNASLRLGSQCLLFITITLINDRIIPQIHICLYCNFIILRIISSYLVLGDHAGRVGVSLAVKTYVIDGILCPLAIVHVDNLGDTRGRRFTFYWHMHGAREGRI